MTGTLPVVLDACVLANFSLCDTLLRIAEPPRLYEPKWSDEIIRETTRTLESKLRWPSSLAAHMSLNYELTSARHGSTVTTKISGMTNDEKIATSNHF